MLKHINNVVIILRQLFELPNCVVLPHPCLQASGGAIRRALGRLERGVCCQCGLDCRTLVSDLQSIRQGTKNWQERRLQLISSRFPRSVASWIGSTPGPVCKELASAGQEVVGAWAAAYFVLLSKISGLLGQ